MKRIICAITLLILLASSGCSTRLDHVGKGPSMSPIGDPRRTVPRDMTPPVAAPTNEATTMTGAGSLWRSGPASLFGDRRARTVGDILTVVVEINDDAEIRNRTDRNRTGQENLSVPAMFGIPSLAAGILPGGADLNPALDATSQSRSQGDGRVQREERITLRLAATVHRVLPNGHLVIFGDQEVRVNSELRDLQVAGVIRPEDISRQNVITYDKIASARVVYGGRGQISDIQQPRLGQQVYDVIAPF